MKRYPVILLLLTCIFFCFTDDDPFDSKLNKNLQAYLKENPATNLFLHIDKTIYSPEESIWFKAYTLSGTVIDSKVLYVRLADEHKNIVVADQFPIYDIRSHGNIFIPDTLKEGNYYLYAFTDRMINFSEKDVFLQKIRVQRELTKRFEAKAIVTDTTKIRRGQRINILITVKEGIDLIKNLRGEYELSDGEKVIKAARITTNLFGEANISLVYPQLPDNKNLKVKATFNSKGKQAELVLNLRHEGNPIRLAAFPEGGSLIEGVDTKIILQANDIKNLPVKDVFKLTANGTEIAKLSTNQYGVTHFNLKPEAGINYQIETLQQSNQTNLVLPVRNKAIGIKTSGSERIQVLITNTDTIKNLFMVCRSQEEVLSVKEIRLEKGDSIKIPVVFKDFPKNVISISVIDEKGNVRAERLLMNKTGKEDYDVSIKTEKTAYQSRKKVNVSFSITNNGAPVTANMSIAVVEKSRIDPTTYKNILNYYYYRFLDGSNCNDFISESIEKDLDDLLITKRWYNNETERVINYTSTGAIKLLPNTGGITGYVISTTRKKPIVTNIVLSSKEGLVAANLDSNFKFSISPQVLQGPKTNVWKINNLDQIYQNGRHELFINRFDHNFDTCYINSSAFYVPAVFNTIQTNKPVPVTKTGNTKMIKAVNINAKYTDIKRDLDRERRELEQAQMNRYCRNGILNCKNHPEDNFPPPPHILDRLAVLNAVAEIRKVPIKNITLPESFPEVDFETGKNAAFASETTLYWNPNISTGKNGQGTFSFFSNDLKGDFVIMLQGIDVANLKPLFGKTSFAVQ